MGDPDVYGSDRFDLQTLDRQLRGVNRTLSLLRAEVRAEVRSPVRTPQCRCTRACARVSGGG